MIFLFVCLNSFLQFLDTYSFPNLQKWNYFANYPLEILSFYCHVAVRIIF